MLTEDVSVVYTLASANAEHNQVARLALAEHLLHQLDNYLMLPFILAKRLAQAQNDAIMPR